MSRVEETTVQVVSSMVVLREDDVTVLPGTRGIVVGYADEGMIEVVWEGYVFAGDSRLDTFHGYRVVASPDLIEVIETGRLLDVEVTQELREEAKRLARGDA